MPSCRCGFPTQNAMILKSLVESKSLVIIKNGMLRLIFSGIETIIKYLQTPWRKTLKEKLDCNIIYHFCD